MHYYAVLVAVFLAIKVVLCAALLEKGRTPPPPLILQVSSVFLSGALYIYFRCLHAPERSFTIMLVCRLISVLRGPPRSCERSFLVSDSGLTDRFFLSSRYGTALNIAMPLYGMRSFLLWNIRSVFSYLAQDGPSALNAFSFASKAESQYPDTF